MEKDNRFEMMKILKGRQDKFIYYIAGLNVASLGFTVSKTYNMTPNGWYDVILAIAILGWILSTITAFRWIVIQFRTMETNLELSDLIKGYYDKTVYTEEQVEKEKLKGIEQLKSDANKCSKSINMMMVYFIFGTVFFISWKIIDMYIKCS